MRVCVFREFPYLYDGNTAYEQTYLRTYAQAPGAAVVVAWDGEHVAGASTCLPLAAETPNVQKPFLDAGVDISKVFYFGESVLERAYRGQGIGVKFFDAREAQARATGHAITTFCAVQRPADHPLRPAGYVPLDEFWHHRGYTKRPDLTCVMSWRDVGAAVESEKTMTFWTKTL
ncbi:GNAT family acetyltransferase [Acidocella aquatica]|uniref:GNAT family acetyltransferase n=1 Tax=Acidocella aquatica TaxID=1922313 RepID=A0ABQ6A7W9_9PROT|nr:GNAT family N-acetyltransferase [Acidocella aquatica]GLR67395.1 GNAT family acetyltransferase [Acidocella aquatica]